MLALHERDHPRRLADWADLPVQTYVLVDAREREIESTRPRVELGVGKVLPFFLFTRRAACLRPSATC